MTSFLSRITALCIVCVCATFSTTAQAADTRMSADEIWFLVDCGFMDEQEAWFILDSRENERLASTTTAQTKGVSGLDLGSGRFKSVSGLDLGSGR